MRAQRFQISLNQTNQTLMQFYIQHVLNDSKYSGCSETLHHANDLRVDSFPIAFDQPVFLAPVAFGQQNVEDRVHAGMQILENRAGEMKHLPRAPVPV